MRKGFFLGVLFLLAVNAYSQLGNSSIAPSVYYTNGKYSNTMSSIGVDAFSVIGIKSGDYFLGGFSTMNIDSSLWKYDQTMFVVGVIGNYYPFYFKANYGFIKGTYNRKDVVYSYDDKTNIFNGTVMYNLDLFYFSFHNAFVNTVGYKNVQSFQTGLRTDWLFLPAVSFSLDPVYSQISDGRKLFSIGGEITLLPFSSLKIQASGFVGKRAYFFNSELLTIFNQDETQNSLIGGRVEYGIWGPITIIASYQSTKFSGYSITYSTIGLKGFITF